MPFADNDGIRIHYQIEGSGPPLVLHTGFGGRLEAYYRNGFVGALKGNYQLILLDPRGQGRSDKPHDPTAYTLRKRVADVLAVLDDVGVPRSHFYGYSMGARIGFGLGLYAQDRFASLILGGMNAYPPEPHPEEDLVLLERGMRAYLGEWERRHGPLAPDIYEQRMDEDGKALAAYLRAGTQYPNFIDELPRLSLPTLIFCGSRDAMYAGAKETAALIPNASFVGFDGFDHSALFWDGGETVLPTVQAFLRQVDGGR